MLTGDVVLYARSYPTCLMHGRGSAEPLDSTASCVQMPRPTPAGPQRRLQRLHLSGHPLQGCPYRSCDLYAFQFDEQRCCKPYFFFFLLKLAAVQKQSTPGSWPAA